MRICWTLLLLLLFSKHLPFLVREVALLRDPKHGYIGNAPLPGGEFRFEVGPPVDGVTRLAFVDCQLPKCGARSEEIHMKCQ